MGPARMHARENTSEPHKIKEQTFKTGMRPLIEPRTQNTQ